MRQITQQKKDTKLTAIITVHGGLTDAPQLKFTSSGTPFATGTVASTERYLDRKTNEWKDGKRLFARFTAWGPLAENIAASNLDKGAQVTVTGKLHTREYDDQQGNKRSSTELELTDFAVSLKHATASVTRTNAQGSQNASFGGGSQSQWANTPPADSGAPSGGFGDGFDQEQPF